LQVQFTQAVCRSRVILNYLGRSLPTGEKIPEVIDFSLRSSAKTETVLANGASKRIKPDQVHKKITPAMTVHPPGAG
jgi:hypothetical protein